MDLVYIPDVLTFGFFRNPQYRDYEQSWNSNYFSNDKNANRHNRQQQQQKQRRDGSSSKESCQLCQENKRRSLAAYIRNKSRNKPCSEICEEVEEEVQEETDVASAAVRHQKHQTDNKPESNKQSADA
ncbi:uncharacterized protein LOC106643628 [Copidosoma floridanum]|uniref:uncharacterized protein LOC106643628 n=1 Tax=Copidosoma floridanum TaxID=29053 RepID=UPI0006C99A25|nr:uncharacterized protein LOC106643628 [Copidosoma floridanum]